MANSTIPNLNAVTVPALTDLFGVRQSGDTRDKKLTASQLLSLGGDVSKVGTPVNNQIGVWTGDGTIEGVSELTYTGVDFILGFNTGRIKGSNTNAGAILNEASSLGNPTLVPNTADSQTGIGGTANNLGVIVRGVAGTRWQHSTAGGGEVRQFQDLTTGIVASTTQTQGNGLVNGAAFTEVTTVANPDDVITLHNTGAAEYWTTIINTGANRLQIFPPVGDAILPGIVNASITLDVNKAVTLYTLDGTNWIRLVDPAGAGGGDVTKVGTPANNQLGVWTGDGTIEGDSGLTWDGSVLTSTGSIQIAGGTPGAAAYSFAGDGNTGVYSPAVGVVGFTADGQFGFKIVETAGQLAYDVHTAGGLSASTTQTQGQNPVERSYGIYTVVANEGDTVTLPAVFALGRVVHFKNDGANGMQIFPASGDTITGEAVNASITLPSGTWVTFIGTTANSVWGILSTGGGVIGGGGGGGDVTKVGTPVNNQLGIWTGDGTLEGTDQFTLVSDLLRSGVGNGPGMRNIASTSGTVPSLLPRHGDPDTGVSNAGDDRIALTAGGVMALRAIEASASISVIDLFGPTVVTGRIRVSTGTGPAMQDEAVSGTNPTLTPNLSDDDSGIGQNAVDQVSIIAGGAEGFRVTEAAAVITNTIFGNLVANGGAGAGPMMKNEGPSSTNPTFVPNQADPDTGLGRDAVDSLSLIAGGVGCLRVREIGGARAVGFYTTTPIVQQTGVAVTAGAIHAALVALGLITA